MYYITSYTTDDSHVSEGDRCPACRSRKTRMTTMYRPDHTTSFTCHACGWTAERFTQAIMTDSIRAALVRTYRREQEAAKDAEIARLRAALGNGEGNATTI